MQPTTLGAYSLVIGDPCICKVIYMSSQKYDVIVIPRCDLYCQQKSEGCSYVQNFKAITAC